MRNELPLISAQQGTCGNKVATCPPAPNQSAHLSLMGMVAHWSQAAGATVVEKKSIRYLRLKIQRASAVAASISITTKVTWVTGSGPHMWIQNYKQLIAAEGMFFELLINTGGTNRCGGHSSHDFIWKRSILWSPLFFEAGAACRIIYLFLKGFCA